LPDQPATSGRVGSLLEQRAEGPIADRAGDGENHFGGFQRIRSGENSLLYSLANDLGEQEPPEPRCAA
jgi:hypothetical protein